MILLIPFFFASFAPFVIFGEFPPAEINIKESPSLVFANFGASYRLDFHKDYESSAEIEDKKLKKEEKELKKTLKKTSRAEKKRNKKARKKN